MEHHFQSFELAFNQNINDCIRHVEQQKELKMNWGALPFDVICLLIRSLKRMQEWSCIGGNLRLLNHHWKQAIETNCMHLSLQRVYELDLYDSLPQILSKYEFTSIEEHPLNEFWSFFVSWKSPIQSFSKLREVSLINMQVGDRILNKLYFLDLNLEKLYLSRLRLGDEGRSILSQFTTLKELHMINLYDDGFTNQWGYPSKGALERLEMHPKDNGIELATYHFLGSLGNLESLTIHGVFNEAQNLSSVLDCANLKYLELRFSKKLHDCQTLLYQMTSLKELKVEGCFPIEKTIDLCSILNLESLFVIYDSFWIRFSSFRRKPLNQWYRSVTDRHAFLEHSDKVFNNLAAIYQSKKKQEQAFCTNEDFLKALGIR